MPKTNYQIPFDLGGNLMGYPEMIHLCLIEYNEQTKLGVYRKNEQESKINLNHYTIINICKSPYGGDSIKFYCNLEPIWKDNYIFESEMRFIGFGRGRSAAHGFLRGTERREYQIFLKDLEELIGTRNFECGIINETKWTFVKRGQNYGIKLG